MRSQDRVGKERVGHAVARHSNQAREDDGEHEHHRERLEQRPESAEPRLLVANVDAMPAQNGKEVAIMAEPAEMCARRNRSRCADRLGGI